jgi:peptide/nickel transport system substrate-binding protein
MRSVRRALAALAIASLAAGLLPPGGQAQSRAPLVRLPIPAYDGTLTPYTFESGYPLMALVYDTLMWRNAGGAPRPWLAQSVQRSQGGRRITIRLREGVRWHDGRPLTAADVAFTFDFMAQRFHPRFTPQLEDVESTTASDPSTVTIELRRRSLGFDDQPLADVPILPRHLWEGLPEGRAAPRGPTVGSGPYRLVRADRRAGYGFQANRSYFNGRPAVDRIRVPVIREEGRTYRALQRRRVDMLPVSLPERPAARLGRASGISVDRGHSYSGTSLLFNLRRPPFDRAAARRAVANALDLERVLRNVGPGVPADHGYIHPSSPWASEPALQRADPPAARRALSRLDLPPLRILAPNNDPLRAEAGRQVGLALRRAGADATVVEVSRSSLGRAIGEDGSTADFEAAIISTPPLASYDPDFLTAIFGADPRDAPLNYSGYRSGAFEAHAERAKSAFTRAARERAVQAELRLLATDLPELPLFFSEGAFAFRPAIYDGWVFVKGTGILDKRSFLPGQGRPSSQREVSAGEEDEAASDDGTSFLDVLSIVSLIALVIVVGLVTVALLSRRRAGRS